MQPLAGLRVLDLADEKGELCGRALADLGAEVIRVEPPEGSISRTLEPFAPDGETSLYFALRNAGKRLPNNLYDQMYHHEYDPEATAERIAELAAASPSLFLTDYHGLWGVGILMSRSSPQEDRPRLIHYREFALNTRSDRDLYFVATSLIRVDRLTDALGWPRATAADRVATTGFFTIYQLHPEAPAH